MSDPIRKSKPPQVGASKLVDNQAFADWRAWSIYVLNELARMNSEINLLRENQTNMRIFLATLKTRYILGGGLLVAVVTAAINLLIHKLLTP